MPVKLPNRTLSIFEQIKQNDQNGNEYWGARKLAKVLEYTDFRNFQSVINKAKEACLNSGQPIDHHLVDFNEVIIHGKGAKQIYSSVKLSRYACYLIVQNANKTHFEVGKKGRQTIEEIGGAMPENLPVEESIKKLETKTTKKKLDIDLNRELL